MARKMSAANRRKVGDVMRAARKRKPTGRKVKFTSEEKSTLRHVMQDHSSRGGARKKKAASTRKKINKNTYRHEDGYPTAFRSKKAETKHNRRAGAKRGRKAGFKHSAATRAKMSKTHKARHRGNKRAADKKRGYSVTPKRKYIKAVG